MSVKIISSSKPFLEEKRYNHPIHEDTPFHEKELQWVFEAEKIPANAIREQSYVYSRKMAIYTWTWWEVTIS